MPIGLFFGRIANFINGELWGRPTDRALGRSIFPRRRPDVARHPSQLYEAALEGVVLFLDPALGDPLGQAAEPRAASSRACSWSATASSAFSLENVREPDARHAATSRWA